MMNDQWIAFKKTPVSQVYVLFTDSILLPHGGDVIRTLLPQVRRSGYFGWNRIRSWNTRIQHSYRPKLR